MKCIHHYDDDGLCSAAIVRFYLKDKPEEPSVITTISQTIPKMQSKMLLSSMMSAVLVVCLHSSMLRWMMK